MVESNGSCLHEGRFIQCCCKFGGICTCTAMYRSYIILREYHIQYLFSIFTRTHIYIYWHWTSHVFNTNIHLDMADSLSNIWGISDGSYHVAFLSFGILLNVQSLGNREWVVCFVRSALVHLPMLTLSCAVLAVGNRWICSGQNLGWGHPKLVF